MTPQQCAEHRGRIGIEVRIILNGYWQPDDSPEMQRAVLAHWLDALEDWPLDAVRSALIGWQMENPNRRPNPGHIVQILKRKRGEEFAARMRQLPKADNVTPIVSDEARARNLAFIADKFPSLVKRIPEAGE